MQVQPHLLLLQKTMVMVEGLATALDPAINMWDVSGPFVKSWIRDELGPEAKIADRLRDDLGTLARLPDLLRRIEEKFPPKGGAPEQAPLPEVDLIWKRRIAREGPGKPDSNHWARYALSAIAGGIAAWAVTYWSILG
jgi:ubiquinone biosynthesis protein